MDLGEAVGKFLFSATFSNTLCTEKKGLIYGHAAAARRGRGRKEGVRRAEGEGGRVATSPGSREIHLGRPRLEDQGGGEVDQGGGEVDRGGGDGGEVQDQRGLMGMQIRW